jgi:hypothetical protein
MYEAFDKAEARNKDEVYNSKTRNYIYVEHNDGTISRYSILSSIKLLVQVGDKVIPGQPLAVFDKQEHDYTMLFDVFYLNLKATSTTGTNYFTARPRFVFESSKIDLASPFTVYPDVIHPIEIVTKELSNKEIKKLGLKH